mgnify:FL=1|jgi:hypothetical protein
MEMEQYDPKGIEVLANNTGRPIPGQSLTNSPDEPRPFETAPEYTNFKKALDYIVGELLQEEVMIPIVSAIGQDVPITDVATQMLYVGFREGKWNPDLLMMLVEPVMYVLMALCEKAGVDYKLYGDEEQDDTEEDEVEIRNNKQKNLAAAAKAKIGNITKVPTGALPQDIVADIQSSSISPSLLAQSQEAVQAPVEPQPQQSLLGPQE